MNEEKKDKIRKFMDKLKEDDFNVIEDWDFKRFKVVCQECQSDDVVVFYREEEGCYGSEYTGYMRGFIHNSGFVIKCKSCGLAMILENIEM